MTTMSFFDKERFDWFRKILSLFVMGNDQLEDMPSGKRKWFIYRCCTVPRL